MLSKKRARDNKNNLLSNEKDNNDDKDNKDIILDESHKKPKQSKNKKVNQKKEKNKNASKSNIKRKAFEVKKTKELINTQKEDNNIDAINNNLKNEDILNSPINKLNKGQNINNNLKTTFKDNNSIIDNKNLTKTSDLSNLNIKKNLLKISNNILNNNNNIKENNLNNIVGQNILKENPNNINYNNNSNFINYNLNINQIKPQNNLFNNILKKNNIFDDSTLYKTFQKENTATIKNNNNNKTISIAPNYIKIFEKINIFNSILIMINNISIINNYFYEDEIINKINICEKNNNNCLSSILYYINKYLWYTDFKVTKYDLFQKYTDFINNYSQINSFNNSIPEKYCYEIKNIELINSFIYNKINAEFTLVNSNPLNNINNNKICEYSDSLSKYIFDFSQKNKSIISDHFFGFYQYQIFCQNCQVNKTMYNMKYNEQYSYNSFSYINFNLNEIKKSNQSYNSYNSYNKYNIYQNFKTNSYNEKTIINLDDCFNFYFIYQNKKIFNNSYCNLCNLNSYKEELRSILSLPNILTIILSNNEDDDYNCNFILQDELNLKNLAINLPDNSEGKYRLISILCKKIDNDEFICYCANPNNGLWYSYTNGKIKNVMSMDINAVPLILIYQIINKIEFEYKSIKRDDLNKRKIKFKFTNGIPTKELFFNKNDTIKNIKDKIVSYFNLGNYKISFVIEGNLIQENRYLYEVIRTSNVILVVLQNI